MAWFPCNIGGGGGLTHATLTYTGQDQDTNEIQFPVKPLFYQIENTTSGADATASSMITSPFASHCYGVDGGCFSSYDNSTNTLSLTGGFPVNTTHRRYCFWQNTYTVHYWY